MATSAQIAQELAKYDKSRKSSADVLNESMAQFGVPEMRGRVANLRTTLTNTENALNAVDPSVTGRTSRSLVTEAQRSAIVNKEREPIAAQYGSQARLLGDESQNLTAQEAAANQLAQGRISDYQTGRSAIESRYQMASSSEAAKLAKAQADRAYKLQKLQGDRSYQLSLASAARSGGSSSTAATTKDITKQLNSALSKATGRDGYVSPQSYTAAKRDWIAQGGSGKKFDDIFANYRNPYAEDLESGAKRSKADYNVG